MDKIKKALELIGGVAGIAIVVGLIVMSIMAELGWRW